MARTIDHLIALMQDCLVQISGAAAGSGFFIGPGVVATCAHVAGAAGDHVTVRWRDIDLDGVVSWASLLGDRRGLAPYPDLAVVTLEPGPDCHPSVWLDDHLPSVPTQLVVAGHAQVYGPQIGQMSGWFTHGGDYDNMIRLTGDEMAGGMSGAPVLNADTGGVCAVAKATRLPNQPAGGGLAVPVRALRAVMNQREYRRLRQSLDAYHRRNRRWSEVADELSAAPGGVADQAQRELRAILARLPEADPRDHLARYRSVAGPLAGTPLHPLYDYGDVVTELADLIPPSSGFPHVIGYAIDLSHTVRDSALAAQLRLWARLVATPLRLGAELENRLAERSPAPGSSEEPIPSVMVCVRPVGPGAARYRCLIWRYVDSTDVTPILTDSLAVPLDELRRRLRRQLPGLVLGTEIGRQRTMIELIVPQELLDEEVDRWPEQPDRNLWSTFGLTRPVVVRELDRFDDDDSRTRYLRERWQALDGQDVGAALDAVPCVDDRDHVAVLGSLELNGALGMLVLPCSPKGPPARIALEAGLYSGIPIMVWRRDGCTGDPGISHDDCPGSRLLAAVQAELGAARRHDVPERVRRLRNRAAVAPNEPEHCGRDVVLLWDDPGRRPPRRPMVSPIEGRHRWVSS